MLLSDVVIKAGIDVSLHVSEEVAGSSVVDGSLVQARVQLVVLAMATMCGIIWLFHNIGQRLGHVGIECITKAVYGFLDHD